MSFPRYPMYKETGVEWLGEVPEHWGVKPLKYVVHLRSGGTPSKTNFSYWNGSVPWASSKDLKTELLADTEDHITQLAIENGAATLVPASSLLIVVRGMILVHTFPVVKSLVPMAINQDLKALTPTRELDIDYLAWLLRGSSAETIRRIDEAGHGTKVLRIDSWTSMSLPVPPLKEQKIIVDYIQTQMAKCDGLVAEQQRLIELLKEKRQAVISHAITKGLNRDATMKRSGIEWLGDVPEHWDVTRLGWICSAINDINHEMPSAVESGVLFLSAKDLLDDGTLNFTTDIKMISEEDFTKLSKKICPRRGDIIYSRIGACLGKARLVETDQRFLISYSCCVVRVIETIACRRFIRHLLDGEMILTEAKMRTQGIGVPDLGLREIGRFPVPLPPKYEQEAISDFLEDEAGKFGTLIAEAQKANDLLQERRTALISAAVTGKIDVRGLAKTETA